ncbi:MAG TPA: signal peptide peptidase SppA [Chitinophagales bacterium]|nr:signal peptide peptidase SppA [Chitinophagales bacterium]HMW11973.1 signal peptide peptidase SppA [Chitinophagales bacterium]HMX60833.1 signal peptide peptidase SppA [Chitinophagales bacterium]HMY24284.1 signal peptide peptidase SppA [Chitinophagales bacterium]HMZ33163.1 signal peptide peptidase SppA [Chitinophagales bacterium]
MRSFLKTFFACLLAFGCLFFFIFVFLIGGLLSSGEKTVKTESNSILNLTLKGEITDRAYSNPFRNISPMAALSGSISDASTIGLFELKDVLEYAKKDDHIKGIYLNLDEIDARPATMFELRKAIEDFKTSKKLVYAYSNATPEINLLVNTVADKFYINPVGGCDFDGFAMQMDYLKGLMDKLGIDFKVFYVGEFKSATESYRRADMSPEDRLQRTELLNDISGDYLNQVAQSTKVGVDSLKAMQNNLSVMDAASAVQYKLANALRYEDEVKDELKERLGYKKSDDLNMISYNDYKSIVKDKTTKSNDNKIAVLFAEGEINDSKSDDGVVGGEAYVKTIQKLTADKSIKGVVLRVNSPGGSAFASEQIHHALMQLKAKKPLVVSMGDYAASGGYYIAAPADKIFAQANTITGSIGIFGLIPNIRKALNEKVGVTFDEVKTAEHANFFNMINDWDELETSTVQKHLEKGYATFLDRVAKGRKMDTAAVNKVARGRVWTGQDALTIGLVDEIGGLDEAIIAVKKLAKITAAEQVNYPKSKSVMESIMSDLLGEKENEQTKLLKNITPQLLFFKQLERFQSLGVYQYRLPFDMQVR